jgi:hypothetical protein
VALTRALPALILLLAVGGCTTRRECQEFCKLVDRCGFNDGPLGDGGAVSNCVSRCLASSDQLREQASGCVDAAMYDVDVKHLNLAAGWCGPSSLICESSRECIEQELGAGFSGVGRVKVVARAADAIEGPDADCQVGHCWDDDKDRVDVDCLLQGQFVTADAAELCTRLNVESVRVLVGAAGGQDGVEQDVDCVGFLRYGASLNQLGVGWVEVGATLQGTQPSDLCGPGVGSAYCVALGTTEVVASASETTAAIRIPDIETLMQTICAADSACD